MSVYVPGPSQKRFGPQKPIIGGSAPGSRSLQPRRSVESRKNRMKLAHSVRAGACLRGLTGALTTGLALAGMTWMPSLAWGQWSGGPTGPVYYNGGNVGIGTSSPDKTLTVSGPIHVYGGINLNDWTEGYFIANQAGMYMPINTLDLRLQTQSIDRMSVTYTGNVGIGTTNPQHLLHVAGTIGAEEVIVSSTGADYVFGPGYRLASLSELDTYIKRTTICRISHPKRKYRRTASGWARCKRSCWPRLRN